MIKWIFYKSIEANFKSNKLQLLHYNNNAVMEPWLDKLLDRYVKYNIINGMQCLSMYIRDDDRCCYFTPNDPRTCLRTNIYDYPNINIKFSISFNEEVDTKFFWIRDTADIDFKFRDVFELWLRGKDVFAYNKHEDDFVIVKDMDIYDKHSFEIIKEDALVIVKHNGAVVLEHYIEFKDEYWFNLGLYNKLKTDNSINIYDFCIT